MARAVEVTRNGHIASKYLQRLRQRAPSAFDQGVVRNGQGREISPYRCRLWAQFQLAALGSLLDGRRSRRDQADILRQVAKGSDGCHDYVPEKRSGYG